MKRAAVRTAATALLLGASAAAAQQISGFSSVPWGATASEIVGVWGRPQRDTVERDLLGRRTLTYHITLLDESVVATFELHPTRGLLGGEYRPFICLQACAGKFERAIREKYPSIAPQRVNAKLAAALAARDSALADARSSADSSSAAFRFGLDSALAESEWSLVWRDPVSGGTIRLDRVTMGTQLVIRYEARDYAAWARELDAAQRRKRL